MRNLQFEPLEAILERYGADIEDKELEATPQRWLRVWEDMLSGYRGIDSVMDMGHMECDNDNPVVVRDIEFFSTCSHHLLPMWGTVDFAYIPDGKLVGLSKIPRMIDKFAKRLQIQEQMTQQIADFFMHMVKPKGVLVRCTAQHFCLQARGVEKQLAEMVTLVSKGVFLTDTGLKHEVLGMFNK
jgi:GTP cyclohydrolase I|tara:strand:- start:671 stop:1222 length:552 start_codon:yes stop_codon:yes gene_type:complete